MKYEILRPYMQTGDIITFKEEIAFIEVTYTEGVERLRLLQEDSCEFLSKKLLSEKVLFHPLRTIYNDLRPQLAEAMHSKKRRENFVVDCLAEARIPVDCCLPQIEIEGGE